MWIGRNIDRLTTAVMSVPAVTNLAEVMPLWGSAGLGLIGGYAAFRGCDALLKKTTNDKLSLRRYAKKTRYLDRVQSTVESVLTQRGLFTEDAPGRVVTTHDHGRTLVRVSVPRGRTSVDVEGLCDALGEALQVHAVRVAGRTPGWVIFEVFEVDGLVSGTELAPAVLAGDQPDVTAPIAIGMDEISQDVPMQLYAQTILVGGSPGSGKSALSWSLLGHAALDPRTVLVVLDLKPYGIETAPIHDRADYVATTSGEAETILERVWLEVDRRNKILRDRMADKADPADVDMPPVVIVCDEAAELTRDGSDEGKSALSFLTRIVAVGRASGIGVVLVTQKPDSSVVPTALRDLMAQRICLRVGTRAQAETILGPLPEGVRPWEIGTDTPGRGYAIDASGHGRLFQAAFIDRESVIEMGQQAVKNRENSGGKRFELPEPTPAPCEEEQGADSKSKKGQQGTRRRRRRR